MQKINQNVIMPELTEQERFDTSNLETVYGRDALAELIERDIDRYTTLAYREPEPRSHLGASIIGHDCERYIWFHFRWMKRENFESRLLRLFNRGHREEEVIFEYLRGIGMQIESCDVDDKQIRIGSDAGGHFGGSLDAKGILPERYHSLLNESFLIEIKTANLKKFMLLKGSGVKKAKKQHYSQSCVYGYKKKLRFLLYICVCKNNDELNVEFIDLDWDLGKAEIEKAEMIIGSYYPPKRMSNDPSYYECGYCPMQGICHLKKDVDVNCRSCRFAQPVADAQWFCHAHKQIIPADFLIKGCQQWESLPR